MSGVHKNPTISFRITEVERRQIEAKIIASGMSKKDYFARSCIYNRVCVVGKKETVYRLVEELREMQTDFLNMLKAILWMLDGARYLWEGTNTCKNQSEKSVTESVSVTTQNTQE